MEVGQIGKKKWRSFKIRWGFISCCAKPRPSFIAPHDTMAIDKNHDDDVYEILPVLEQEEPIATMTNEETREMVEEAEMPLTGYSTISYLVEEEEENKKSEEMVGYSTLSFMKEEEENKESEGQQRCSACEGRPRGTALIQCGHTFCRLCAREMPGDIDGLGAPVVALGDRELDALSLGEGPEPVGLDGRLVDEEILSAVVGRDEAESLGVVEPLHRALGADVHWIHRRGGRTRNAAKRGKP
ncbi:hypothetical protein ZIOFF_042903 [Zingiber officinale]|uniref:Zinc finger C3HC4 RING-type domain-containing protein n=1 Tax=Zingiber officinale TaxID=94328 RepID=A0A8J5FY78_ZINOF|nr:hypothetical protein ZIOFF_042903 [Zingiber officinale]